MLSKVWSAATLGIEAVRIIIEVDARIAQQPGFTLVGLPDPAVRESYSRVRSALINCGFYPPTRHITVNLSPADVRKEGSGFDHRRFFRIEHELMPVIAGNCAPIFLPSFARPETDAATLAPISSLMV